MIANICALWLCCFAITSNIKTIESAGNQIFPIRFFVQPSDKNYVCTINNLKTFNKHPIVINSTDRKILSEPRVDSIKYIQLNLKSRDKLEKKGKDIKCSFCVFAKSNITVLKDLVEELKTGERQIYNKQRVKSLEEDAKIILRLLMWENLETSKWLWMYFLKIVAIRHYDDNKSFIIENPFEDDELYTSVSESIRNCITENYLPPTAMESDLVSNNKNIYNEMFSALRDSIWVMDVLNGRVLVTIEFLYLKPFWEDENQLLFRPVTAVNVDWSEPKRRHEAEVAITATFVENRSWMYKPYGRFDHQRLLINIIDARIYCYLSVILHMYEKQLSILGEETLTYIKYLTVDVIASALCLTGYRDEFLVIIVSELKFAKITDNEDIKDILTRVRAKANEIINELNGTSISRVDRLSFNVNQHQLSNDDLITTIIEDLEDYLTEFQGFLPFEYKTLLHFMDVVKLSAAHYI